MKIQPKQAFEMTAVEWHPEMDNGMPIHGRANYGIQSSHMAGAMCLRVIDAAGAVRQVLEGQYLIFRGGALVQVLDKAAFVAEYDVIEESHEENGVEKQDEG
jgi:hypothetical protein